MSEEQLLAELNRRYGKDPIVRKMIERGYPLTGEQYLALAYLHEMPEDIDHLPSDIYYDIPEPLRRRMR
jgi:hypothetical protein